MPIYDYRCTACGHETEALQKISDAPLTECPKCKQQTLVKKVTAAGFQLKGSGWYVTDFRGGSGTASGGKTAGTETKSDTSSSAGDSKPSDSKSSDSKPADSGGAGSGKDSSTTAGNS